MPTGGCRAATWAPPGHYALPRRTNVTPPKRSRSAFRRHLHHIQGELRPSGLPRWWCMLSAIHCLVSPRPRCSLFVHLSWCCMGMAVCKGWGPARSQQRRSPPLGVVAGSSTLCTCASAVSKRVLASSYSLLVSPMNLDENVSHHGQGSSSRRGCPRLTAQVPPSPPLGARRS